MAAGNTHAAQPMGPAPALQRVRLCTSLPLGIAALRPLARGINNSAILATEQWRSRFRAAHLLLLPPRSLDDATLDGSQLDPNREKENAHHCLASRDVFGYIGPLNSRMTIISEPILNRAAVVQINPANTNDVLTSPVARKTLEPATYSHRLAYPTFYRLITTDLLQGPADAAFMREALHARDYFLVDEPFEYGSGVAAAVQAYATKIGLRLLGAAEFKGSSPSTVAVSASAVTDIIAAKQPDAVFCGCDAHDLGAAFAAPLRRKGYSGPLVGPDAFLTPDFITLNGTGAANSYASNVGLDPAGASKAFQSAYRRRFHVSLQYYDTPAYDAANINLYAIYQAATHGRLHGTLFQMRASILPYVAHVRWHGATGLTSFDGNGDTRYPVISMYAVQKGEWRFVGKAPKVKGVSPTG